MFVRPSTCRGRMQRSGSLVLGGLLTALAPSAGCLKVPDDLLEEPKGPAGAPSTAQELLDRHVQASGGEEALRKLPQRTVEARVVFKAQPGCEAGDEDCMAEDLVGQFVLNTTADGRMYQRMVVGDNVLERGFDGEKGWQMQSNPRVLVLEDPEATPMLREDALLHWYFDLEPRELALELLPSRKSEDGRELDGIRWIAASETRPEAEKWFDRATGLLYEEIDRDTETGDIVRRVYEDYREVDGVQVPWLIKQITVVEELELQNVELHVQAVHHRPVDEVAFAVPELAPVEPEADPLLTYLDQARAAVEAAPDDARALVTLARVAFTTAHFDEAREVARKALKVDSKELEALYILARIDLFEGNLAGAEKTLKTAVAQGLREDEAARQFAWIALRRGQWDKAAKHLRDAGNDQLAERYEAFDGTPLAAKMGGDGCRTRVPIEFTQDSAIVVAIQAEGETLKLLLDTGASDVIISDEKARRLVIATDATAPLSAGGPPLPQGQLDRLEIGAYAVENVPVTMFPADQFNVVVGLDGVDGILGVRPLAGRQLTVDIERRELELVETSKKCGKALAANRSGAAVPFWMHETHYIYVLGRMNDAEGVYLVNTGMRGADLTANEGAYAYAGIGAPPMMANQGAALAKVPRFDLGKWAVVNVVAAWGFMSQNATSDSFRLDGMLGLGVLGKGSWTIDFSEQRLYVRPTTGGTPALDSEDKSDKGAPAKQPASTKTPSEPAPTKTKQP